MIVVGGPQYRVGSHRQFLLLARSLAAAGIPVLRFDYRGMGDSEGVLRDFRFVGEDLNAAINVLVERSGVDAVVLWGLCDGASACMLHGPLDNRVRSMVLLNPWVHTEETAAAARLENYYRSRLLSPDLWKKIVTLDVSILTSLRDFMSSLFALFREQSGDHSGKGEVNVEDDFIGAMLQSMRRFDGEICLILSGNDLTADEFRQLLRDNQGWAKLADGKFGQRTELEQANHTLASARWRGEVERVTREWIEAL